MHLQTDFAYVCITDNAVVIFTIVMYVLYIHTDIYRHAQANRSDRKEEICSALSLLNVYAYIHYTCLPARPPQIS